MQPEIPLRARPPIPGFIHYEQERYEVFLQWAEEGLARDPESLVFHEHRFIYRALHGDWTRAWPDWEYREYRQRFLRRFAAWPEWRGDSIRGKTLLVAGEMGIGDQIMFSRWLDRIPGAGEARVVLAVRPELRRWNFGFGEWLKVIVNGEHLPHFDCWIGLESLPLATGVPMPFPAGERRDAIRVKRVGICWHGTPEVRADVKRSTDFSMWLRLLEIPGIRFQSLQYRECPDPRMEPLDPGGDIVDTARRMEELDLVITVDTAIGHVAGALGVPVWMLSYRAPEWRWGLDGERTVWYPSMRIFRQERRGEWEPVFGRVEAELRKAAG